MFSFLFFRWDLSKCCLFYCTRLYFVRLFFSSIDYGWNGKMLSLTDLLLSFKFAQRSLVPTEPRRKFLSQTSKFFALNDCTYSLLELMNAFFILSLVRRKTCRLHCHKHRNVCIWHLQSRYKLDVNNETRVYYSYNITFYFFIMRKTSTTQIYLVKDYKSKKKFNMYFL